jgi:hypothetical protein
MTTGFGGTGGIGNPPLADAGRDLADADAATGGIGADGGLDRIISNPPPPDAHPDSDAAMDGAADGDETD